VKLWFMALLLWLAGATVLAAPNGSNVNVGVLTYRPPAVTRSEWQPLVDHLNTTIPSHRFTLQVYDFNTLQDAIRRHVVDVVVTNPTEYVRMAHHDARVAPLATIIDLEAGRPTRGLGGVILTGSDRADINTLKDLNNQRIAAAGLLSFGAYQMQAYEMQLQDVHAGTIVVTGLPQENAITSLMAGHADAAFVRTGLMEDLVREGKLDPKRVKVVNPQYIADFPLAASTRLYPDWPVVAMAHLPDELKARIAGTLLSLEHGSVPIKRMGLYGFSIPANYDSVRTVMRAMRAPPFDTAPEVSLEDIWARYQIPILALALALGALVLLAARELVLKQRLAAIGDAMGEGMYVLDRRGRVTYVNRAACALLGAPRAQLMGTELLDQFLSPTATSMRLVGLHPLLDPAQHREPFEGESVFINAQGRHFPVDVSVRPVLHKGKFVRSVTVFSDISARKAQSEQVYKLAYYDPNTDLPNRRLLLNRLQLCLDDRAQTGLPGALLFSDLDRFKQLNDTLGHQLGDALLREAAQRISRLVGDEGTVAHSGGDEFAVLLGHLDADIEKATAQVQRIAEGIRVSMQQPFALEGQHHTLTVSIGIAMFGGHGNDPGNLIKQADIAMYQAKAGGRNTIRFFDQAAQTQLNSQVALEADLHSALAQQQFMLHYQPQVDASGAIFGVEALLRWHHPQRGLVSPAEFIPLAEETGLIVPLGQWVLEQACAQIHSWSTNPATAHWLVAVNISVHQVIQADFVTRVTGALRAYNTAPKKLQLELTESVLAKNVDDTIDKMQQLVALGVTFSLDDFGTGYSSLSYLKRLPMRQLKIDASFVRDILNSPNDATITQTIIALGDNLGLEVIAEGVELEAQKELLAKQGCRFFQGYFFGRPQSAAALTQQANASSIAGA
jgi:diguanylate cyclase (GGDEF)-like protein/PAS domain S-box-containing protein